MFGLLFVARTSVTLLVLGRSVVEGFQFQRGHGRDADAGAGFWALSILRARVGVDVVYRKVFMLIS
jgi:hypothetical protein